MANSVSTNVGVPDLDWVERATHLFRDNGPYLVAMLFFAISVSLLFARNPLAKGIAVASFVLLVAFASIASYVWMNADTNRLNPNVRYVLLYEVRDSDDVIGTIERVAVPANLTETMQGFASRREHGTINFIIVSRDPINSKTLTAIYVYFQNLEYPSVLCPSHLQTDQELELVKDGSFAQGSGNPFIFKSLISPTVWEPVTCAG